MNRKAGFLNPVDNYDYTADTKYDINKIHGDKVNINGNGKDKVANYVTWKC
jgi:hypothetical protein